MYFIWLVVVLFQIRRTGAVSHAATANEDKTQTLSVLTGMYDVRQDVVAGGYGNRNSDIEAFMNVGIRPNLLYIVNGKGQLTNISSGQKSSYQSQIQNINILYPPPRAT